MHGDIFVEIELIESSSFKKMLIDGKINLNWGVNKDDDLLSLHMIILIFFTLNLNELILILLSLIFGCSIKVIISISFLIFLFMELNKIKSIGDRII